MEYFKKFKLMETRIRNQVAKPFFWAVVFIIIAILAPIPYFLKFYGSYSDVQDHWGAFGEYVGGFSGTILSLVAILLIYLTYRLQDQ